MAETIGRGILAVGFDEGQAAQAAAAFKPTIGRITGDLARGAVAVKLFQIGKEGLDELKQAEAANAQLASVIQSTGNAAGISAEHVDDLSQKALKLAGVDDEAAKNADTLLLQLGKFANTDLGHANFDRAAASAVDLSVRMGTDVPAAARALAVVLQAPEKGMGRLRRSVGDLSAEQKASIDNFVAVGDSAGAQAVILDKLNQAVGGAGAAYGETLAGKVKIAQESMKNMKAELVAGAAPALKFTADVVTTLTEKFDELPGPAQTVIGSVVLVGGAVGALLRPVGDAVRIYDSWRAAHQTVEVASETLTSTLEAEEAAQATLGGTTATTTALMASSSGELDAAAVRRVLSNESITFSDQEIQAAQASHILSNDALIASEAEQDAADAARIAAMEAQTAASGGLVASLGPLAIAAGIVGGAALLLESNLDGVTNSAVNQTSAVDGLTKALQTHNEVEVRKSLLDQLVGPGADQSLTKVVDDLRLSGVGLGAFFNEIERGTKTLGPLAENSTLADEGIGLLKEDLGDAATSGDVFAQSLLGALNSGALTKDQVVAIIRVANDLSGSFGAARGKADALTGGLQDVGAASDPAATGLDNVAKSQEQIQADHIKVLEDQLKNVQAEADTAFAAILRLAPADIRAQQGKIAISDDEARISAAQEKIKWDQASGASAATLAQDQRDLETAQLTLQTATLDEAAAMEELNKQQILAAGGNVSQQDETYGTIGALQGLNAEITGPTHDALSLQIWDMTVLANKQRELNDLFTQGANTNQPGYFNTQGGTRPGGGTTGLRANAGGGGAGPGEVFRGAEKSAGGFEVMLDEGMYQAPPKGGYVLNHDKAAQFMSAHLGGGGNRSYVINAYGDQLIRRPSDIPDAIAVHDHLVGL